MFSSKTSPLSLWLRFEYATVPSFCSCLSCVHTLRLARSTLLSWYDTEESFGYWPEMVSPLSRPS